MASSIFINPSITSGSATTSVIPTADNTYDLGSASFQWRTGYFGTGVTLASAGVLAWSTDLKLQRDSANVLAQRNGTNAQTFRLARTWTSATDKEELEIGSDSTSFFIQTQKGAAGGTARDLKFATNSTGRWYIGATSGHLLANGAYNLGDGAGNSPVTVFAESRVNHGALTFATLPSGIAGDVAYITNSNTATWGATAAGGGANKVLVWFNGTVWTVIGA